MSTEKKIPYWQQLQDPRWIMKRREIIQRDNGLCCFCSSGNNLQIHHLYYVAKRKAWEYSNDVLFTLCDECHKKVTQTGMSTIYNWEKILGLFTQSMLSMIKAHKGIK